MGTSSNSSGSDDRDRDADLDSDAEPVTERVHDNSWSANLEKPHHAESRDLVVEQARQAVEHTAGGNHVNLVTHGDHGHPETYLYDALAEAFGDDSLSWEYVEQCGCGGHVTRVHVE
ncbi:CGCGG family rSAM-modified RiPP protein (plasmid) [Halorussus limi]|uniref:CGCGG family rSAM-modified RiPP protein n=1 Tax=Halorussus limi TaxID=2938695 RepID=A0A8U0I1G8_9EURY|nr:CGCGG family rSAM-modified RiPP protein [Halorussus limi]UPV76584.1 CGCGG family rSAM-modified RiPP protein [Halorussus limi]